MILAVPIVVASLRLNHRAVIATWLVSAAAMAACGQWASARIGGDAQSIVERLGFLLAVAASVALLTRWLREGWNAQAELTAAAEQRVHRLSVVENAARAMRSAISADVIDLSLSAAVRLGFDAATAAGDNARAAGDGDVVPSMAVIEPPEPDEVVITRWVDADDVIHSASVIEPESGNVITGWCDSPIEDGLAESLGDLAANATNALRAALHYERARFEATHDPLTGLANRAEVHERLNVAAARNEPLAVLFIDLDHFKPVNDTFGHHIGDRLLTEIAARISQNIRPNDLAARYGGDEFVILTSGPNATSAANLAERVRQLLLLPFRLEEDIEVSISASIGVAAAIGPVDADQILQVADAGAYGAKHEGRNQVHIMRAVQDAEPVASGI
ncbi:MAG: diguanylate cyclase [Acidimicrobiales bacterium]